MLQQRSTKTELICRIDVTGFAAIMLALVALFLLPFAQVIDLPGGALGIAVDLARASHAAAMPGAYRDDALLVAVERDGRVWFNTDQVTPDQLPAKLRERVSRGAERRVYIRADRRCKYGKVVQVLDSVRSAGIEDIAFLVEERKATSTRGEL